MMALKDEDHVVRLSAYKIGKKCNKKEEDVLKALKVLSEPDTKRLEEQEFEGRRIQKVHDGWLVLNGQKYQEMIQEMIRDKQQARWAREERMILRAVRTGEGIPPTMLNPNLRMRYKKALQRAKKSEGLEVGAKDLEDWIERGVIPEAQSLKSQGLGFSRNEIDDAAERLAAGLQADPESIVNGAAPLAEEEKEEKIPVAMGYQISKDRAEGKRPMPSQMCHVNAAGECDWDDCPLIPYAEAGDLQTPCPLPRKEDA